MLEENVRENIRYYDFTMAQEVLNEYAAGVWTDYIRYCNAHGIEVGAYGSKNTACLRVQE